MHIVEIHRDSSKAKIYLDQIFALRAKIFSHRLGWRVRIFNGLEIDEFDFCNPTYLALVGSGDTVLGGVRLLPIDGPTMVGTTFRALIPANTPPLSGNIVESSRFFVDTEAINGPGDSATKFMMASIVSWAAAKNYERIVTVTDVRIERLMRRIGIPFSRLSEPERLGNTLAVVLSIPADHSIARSTAPDGRVPFGADLQPAA